MVVFWGAVGLTKGYVFCSWSRKRGSFLSVCTWFSLLKGIVVQNLLPPPQEIPSQTLSSLCMKPVNQTSEKILLFLASKPKLVRKWHFQGKVGS